MGEENLKMEVTIDDVVMAYKNFVFLAEQYKHRVCLGIDCIQLNCSNEEFLSEFPNAEIKKSGSDKYPTEAVTEINGVQVLTLN